MLHVEQNRAAWSLTALHRLHRLTSSGEPQSVQNFAPAGLTWSQKWHWGGSIDNAWVSRYLHVLRTCHRLMSRDWQTTLRRAQSIINPFTAKKHLLRCANTIQNTYDLKLVFLQRRVVINNEPMRRSESSRAALPCRLGHATASWRIVVQGALLTGDEVPTRTRCEPADQVRW